MNAPEVALAIRASADFDEAHAAAEVVAHAVAPHLVHVVGKVGVVGLEKGVYLVQLHHARLKGQNGLGNQLQIGLRRPLLRSLLATILMLVNEEVRFDTEKLQMPKEREREKNIRASVKRP